MGFSSWFKSLFTKSEPAKVSEISYFSIEPSKTTLSYGDTAYIQPVLSLSNDAISYIQYSTTYYGVLLSHSASTSSNAITATWNGNAVDTYYPYVQAKLTTVSGLTKTVSTPLFEILPNAPKVQKGSRIDTFSISLSQSCLQADETAFITPFAALINDSIKCVYYACSDDLIVSPKLSYSSDTIKLQYNSNSYFTTEKQGCVSAELVTNSGLSKKAYAYITLIPQITYTPSINSFRVDTSAKTISYNGTTTLTAYADISYDGIKSIKWVTNSKKIKLSYSAGSTNKVVAQNTASTASLVKVYSYLETNSGLKTSTYVNIRVTGQPTGYTTYNNNNITYTYYNGQISYYSYYNGISYYTYYI